MARSIRIHYPGVLFQLMARGNRHEDVFLSDDDRETFLCTLGEAWERYGGILAWVLMSNHDPLAWRLTSVPQGWIAVRSNIQAAGKVRQQVRRFLC